MKKQFILFLAIASLGLTTSSLAAGGVAVEVGQGNSTSMGRASLIQKWDERWFADGDWYLTGYWEASLGRWNSDVAGGRAIWDVGLTPVFRLQPKAMGGFRPYMEGAVGAHLISHTHVDARRDMGVAFQFGSHVGAGLVFGDRGQFDLGYRFQHLSNADLKKPNPGINFQQLRFAYLF